MDNTLPTPPNDNFDGNQDRPAPDVGLPIPSEPELPTAPMTGMDGMNGASVSDSSALDEANQPVANYGFPPTPMTSGPDTNNSMPMANDSNTNNSSHQGFRDYQDSLGSQDFQENQFASNNPLPEIPVIPVTNEPPLPPIETSLPSSPTTPLSSAQYQPSGYQSATTRSSALSGFPKLPFNKNIAYVIFLVVLVGGAGLFILSSSDQNPGISIQDPDSPDSPRAIAIIEEPVAEADKAVLAENVSKFSGTYKTSTEVSAEEIPDPDSPEPDMPRRFDRTLVLNQDNTTTMTSIVNDQTIVESGKWAYNLSSNTIKIEFSTASDGPVSSTRVIAFDAIMGNALVAQSYDTMIYPDVDIVFYKE